MKRNKTTLSIALLVTIMIGLGVSIAGGTHGARIGPISVFLLCGILAFGINWLAFIPANAAKTEHFYDLTGSLTYVSITAAALILTPNLDIRAMLVGAMVMIWSIRLGTFLFMRISKDGKDDRFDEIKTNPLRFLFAWTMQGLWALFTAACALAIITSEMRLPLGALGILGLVLWVIGFTVEVTADAQKRAFRKDTSNKGRFITSGLWAWSRHPNYFGEILLWTGIAVMALPILQGWQWVTLISPIFVFLLLTRLSGIPMLQKKAEERWGDDPEYRDYVEKTSLLLPMPPTR